MVITHNMSAMNSNRQLGITTSNAAKSQEKLASGYKINRAADDAAGLSISEKMRKQVRGLDRATDNSYDGISLVQIADGAMAEVHDMLQRANVLSIQAANGTMSFSDKMDCQREIDKIKNEIDAIQERTKFNEVPVLKGYTFTSDGKLLTPERMETVIKYEPVQVEEIVPVYGVEISGEDVPQWLSDGFDQDSLNAGVMNGDYVDESSVTHSAAYIDFSGFDPSKIDELNGKGFYSTCCTCTDRYSIEFDSESDELSAPTLSVSHYIYKVGIKSVTSAEEIIDRILEATKTGATLGFPRGHNTKYAKDGNKLIIYDIRSKSSVKPVKAAGEGLFGKGIARAVKTGETKKWVTKYVPHEVEELVPATYEELRTNQHKNVDIPAGSEADMTNKILIELPYISCKAMNIEDVNVSAPGGAEESIRRMGDAIAYVSAERARMGAYQNRMEHTVKNLGNVVENTQAAETRLRDTDMADEMVKYSIQSILMNAGQSVLAQANQTTSGVMALLQG